MRAARASFGRNSFYIMIGDHLTQILTAKDQELLSGSQVENSSTSLSVLSMITVFQYLESLTDSQAIEAVRTRVDWKYALHLPLNYPGFAPHRLCKERCRLRNQAGVHGVFQNMVDRVANINNGCGIDLRVEAQTLVQTVCRSCRLGIVMEAMQLVLEVLASHHSDWLRQAALPHWYKRYDPAMTWEGQFNYSDLASGVEMIGADVLYLLERIEQHGIPAMLAYEEVQNLESVYHQQYENIGGKACWRTVRCATCDTAGGLYLN